MERLARMVFDNESQWAAIASIARKLGMSTLLPSRLKRERLKALGRENRELRRANEMLKAAAAFVGSARPLTEEVGGGPHTLDRSAAK